MQYYRTLGRHEGIWRMDGVGETIGNSANTQRYIKFHFSRLKDDFLETDTVRSIDTLKTKNLADPIDTLQLILPPAALMCFRVGTVWKDGHLVTSAPYINGATFHLEIKSIQFFRLGDPITIEGFKIRSAISPIHFNISENYKPLVNSWYAIVRITPPSATEYVVIPCAELFRFYIGASERIMSKALFEGFDDWIDWSKSNHSQAAPCLFSKRRISRKEALVFIRALANKAARKSLELPRSHLATSLANNSSVPGNRQISSCIKATFPFEDTTTLSVRGKRMPLVKTTDREIWAVFAMEILHCGRQFDFENESVMMDEGVASNESLSGTDATAWATATHDWFLEDEDMELNNLPADADVTRLVIKTYNRQFHRRLAYKLFKGHTASDGRFNPHSSHQIPEAAGYTTESSENNPPVENNVGVSPYETETTAYSRKLDTFLDVLVMLRAKLKLTGIELTTRALHGNVAQHHPFIVTILPDKIGRSLRWYKISIEGQTRPRHVVWVEFEYAGEYCYLAELELRENESGHCTLLFQAKDGYALTDKTFEDLLVLTAHHNRWPHEDLNWNSKPELIPRSNRLFSTIEAHAIIHPNATKRLSDSYESETEMLGLDSGECVETILRKMRGVLPWPICR